MPESFVGVPPDSTGKKVHTRQRTVGGNVVDEEFVIMLQSEAVPVNRVWASSLRIPSRAVAIGGTQALFSVWNGIATGGNNISCRRLSVEIDTNLAQTTLGPILRLHRMNTQATTPGGTVLTPERQYTTDPAMNTLVSIRADHQGDNASATTQLALGTINAQPMWSQTVPRQVSTGAGFYVPAEFNLLPNDPYLNSVDPLILRPGEGFAVQVTAGGTAFTAGTYTFMVKAVLAEFTYP